MKQSDSLEQKDTVLVIDDERAIVQSMTMILEYAGFNVIEALDGLSGIHQFQRNKPDAVFLDIKMPGMDGLEVLQQLQNLDSATPVIIISGHGSVDTAVQTTKLGAFDFIEKPLEKERILLTLRNALRYDALQKENVRLKSQMDIERPMIGQSQRMNEVKELIKKAGPTQATVLITGESGTGKELVARAIHENSKLAHGPFIQVNCAAIPEELIENELFGHEKGSYSGASERLKGKFELADGGTIFLDEIADMSLKTQAKVLRVLQEKEFQRVGGTTVLTTQTRVVTATNKNLIDEIKEGKFREDLFFRLNVFPISVPPLRQRKEDIEELIHFFAQEFCKSNGIKQKSFKPSAIKLLKKYNWPGNIRELKNVVERILILNDETQIEEKHIPLFEVKTPGTSALPFDTKSMTLKEFKETTERFYLVDRLNESGWNIQKTAEAIDTPRSNLYRKIDNYKISEETDRH